MMDVHFEVVGKAGGLRAVLEASGWRLDRGGHDLFTASHSDVGNQPAARNRLLKMGLLTSGHLRIEFGPSTN